MNPFETFVEAAKITVPISDRDSQSHAKFYLSGLFQQIENVIDRLDPNHRVTVNLIRSLPHQKHIIGLFIWGKTPSGLLQELRLTWDFVEDGTRILITRDNKKILGPLLRKDQTSLPDAEVTGLISSIGEIVGPYLRGEQTEKIPEEKLKAG